MYNVTADRITWNGKPIKGADPDSFKVLAPIVGQDARQVYVLGKPFAAEPDSFEILSDHYARDAQRVFFIMPTKLKPIKDADPVTFVALLGQHGRDASTAYLRDKRLRMAKGTTPADLRSYGHVYATDGTNVLFVQDKIEPPPGVDLTAPATRLRWFDQNEVNAPPFALTDGAAVWVRLNSGRDGWTLLAGADFDKVAPLHGHQAPLYRTQFARDANHVWFNGTVIAGADAARARNLGGALIACDEKVWCGATPLDAPTKTFTYIGPYAGGDLVHHGDRLTVYAPDTPPVDVSTDPAGNPTLHDIIKPLLADIVSICDGFLPMRDGPFEIVKALPDQNLACPDLNAQIDPSGDLVMTLADGTLLRQPVSCWYTLGCHLWCQTKNKAPELIPFPSVGTMLPRSHAMQERLIVKHKNSVWHLASYVFAAGHKDQAHAIAHMALTSRSAYNLEASDLPHILAMPPDLIAERHYRPAHYGFKSTTNLAVARLIIGDSWLNRPDFRDRLDVVSVLHGAILSTNKLAQFMAQVMPALLDRHANDPHPAVREQIALTLEAALIAGQVDAEVNQLHHFESMLPLIRYCIAAQINTTFNYGRLAQALWATGDDEKANAAADQFVALHDENTTVQGVYAHRLSYRSPRLWLVKARADLCLQSAPLAALQAQVENVKADLNAFLQTNLEAQDWAEFQDLAGQLSRISQRLNPD